MKDYSFSVEDSVDFIIGGLINLLGRLIRDETAFRDTYSEALEEYFGLNDKRIAEEMLHETFVSFTNEIGDAMADGVERCRQKIRAEIDRMLTLYVDKG